MRSRLGVLLVAGLVLTLVAVGSALLVFDVFSSPAPRVAARASPANPIAGEDVQIKGSITPSRRPLVLQRYEGGSWSQVPSSPTSSAGPRYAFTVTASSTPDVYRTFAPEVRIEGKEYPSRYSRRVRVAAVTPTASMTVVGAAVGQSRDGGRDLTPGEATFWPPRPGAPVTVQRRVGGTWRTVVASGEQGRAGRFRFQIEVGTGAKPPAFRAVTRPIAEQPPVMSSPVEPAQWREVWNDEFDGTTLDAAKWQTRVQSPGGRRLCATPHESRVAVRDGIAELSIRRVGRTAACPHGVFQNAMIGTGGVTSPGYWAKYGIFAARVKFQSGQGQHGSFWLQGPRVTGAEIDVAEYFGDGRTDGGLSSFVHHTGEDGELASSGGSLPGVSAIIGTGRTPADGFHVYSVEWSPSGYTFRLDGVPTLRTSKPYVANAPEIMILSLLTSDWELPRLNTTSSVMEVDWVRAWQE